uniref:Uncharacterized protein n=1 Tax=Seriola dumerili TaxID=41447 RepID=A0A3B4V4Q6_SERDU
IASWLPSPRCKDKRSTLWPSRMNLWPGSGCGVTEGLDERTCTTRRSRLTLRGPGGGTSTTSDPTTEQDNAYACTAGGGGGIRLASTTSPKPHIHCSSMEACFQKIESSGEFFVCARQRENTFVLSRCIEHRVGVQVSGVRRGLSGEAC